MNSRNVAMSRRGSTDAVRSSFRFPLTSFYFFLSGRVFGFKVCWISRTGIPLDPLGPKPDLVVRQFRRFGRSPVTYSQVLGQACVKHECADTNPAVSYRLIRWPAWAMARITS